MHKCAEFEILSAPSNRRFADVAPVEPGIWQQILKPSDYTPGAATEVKYRRKTISLTAYQLQRGSNSKGNGETAVQVARSCATRPNYLLK